MSEAVFQITRVDGRSNAQVLVDYVKDLEPGRTIAYKELIKILSAGTDSTYSVSAVQKIVTSAHDRLLKDCHRALRNVKRVGYVVAHANEHNSIALARHRKSDVQLRKGLKTLKYARWDEMDPASREVAQGTMMVMGAMYQQQQALDRRLSVVEAAIKGLKA